MANKKMELFVGEDANAFVEIKVDFGRVEFREMDYDHGKIKKKGTVGHLEIQGSRDTIVTTVLQKLFGRTPRYTMLYCG